MPERENAVIFHHPDAVDTSRDNLMGRQVAGAGFLQGFVRHSGVPVFYCQTPDDAYTEDFEVRVKQFGGQDRKCIGIPLGQLNQVAGAPTTLMLPTPDIGMYAWRRRISAHARSYSLCGVNHALSSDTAMDGLGELLTSPLQTWDALVCTSHAAKRAVQHLLDNWSDFLSRRSGGRFKAQLQMPVIPLGVDCQKFAASAASEEARIAIRRGLGIREDDVAVLYFGRLSFHAKAHPLAMYLGLEETVRRSGKKVHLLQAGRFPNDGVEKEFRDAASQYCPNVNTIFLDGRDPAVSERVWFAADIFASLSDNIQESFGLTPIEAKAAGLPVVASNWDGYRDTIRHGTDGVLVPTWLPLPESGSDLSLRMEGASSTESREKHHNHYSGIVSQSTAVDVKAAADAFVALAVDPALRKRMGDAGRKHAMETFDWQVVVTSYQDLWRELANIRARSVEAVPLTKGRPAHPLRDDPFSLFAGHASATIDGDTLVSLADPAAGGLLAQLDQRRRLTMNNFAQGVMLADEDISRVGRELAAHATCSVIALAEPLSEAVRFRLPRTLAWLAKLGLLSLSTASQGAASPLPKQAPPRTEAQSLVNLGRAARSRGALEAAAEYFEKALKAEPDHVEANFQFGELLAAARKLEAATACLRRAVAGDEKHLGARRTLGKVLFLSGDERAALQVLEEAVQCAPEDVETRYLIGAGYRRAGSANNAITHLQAALELDPKRSDALTHLALARKSLGRLDEARQAIEQALDLDPSNVFARAAHLSFRSEASGRKNITRSETAKKVGIHINRRFHFPLLRPVFEALAEDHWPLITGDGRELIEFDPEVVVVCDNQVSVLRTSLPHARFVQTRKSLASKNYGATVSDPGDFICMPSPAMARQFSEQHGVKADRLWSTGYVGNDALFKRKSKSLPFDLPLDKKVVLYAPTHTPSMTSVNMLGDEVVSLICGDRDDICLILKPHPNFCELPSQLLASWQTLAASDERVFLLDDPEADVATAMQASDLLVSDASGVMFQYLILDRPLVLLTAPEKSRDAVYFDADGPEWAWRQIGLDVDNKDKLAEAVARCLDDPALNRDHRMRCRDLMFGDLTAGDAAERIARQITAIEL